MDTSKVVSEKSSLAAIMNHSSQIAKFLTMVDAVIITLLPFFIEMLQYDWL